MRKRLDYRSVDEAYKVIADDGISVVIPDALEALIDRVQAVGAISTEDRKLQSTWSTFGRRTIRSGDGANPSGKRVDCSSESMTRALGYRCSSERPRGWERPSGT